MDVQPPHVAHPAMYRQWNRITFLHTLPWLSRFGEVNVRTYVRDIRGRQGIWFLSLDAARLRSLPPGPDTACLISGPTSA